MRTKAFTLAVLDWNVDFADSQDNAFVVYNSRQVINVVLYVKPKQRKVGVDGTGGAGADCFPRADSLGSGLGNDGEGTMAKLIKKQQILVALSCPCCGGSGMSLSIPLDSSKPVF